MEGSASAPTHPQIELEPPEWQPRAMRAGARGLCGAIAFFLLAFVFAYFYLRAQDPNKGWKIGAVNPSIGLGIAHRRGAGGQRGGDARGGHAPRADRQPPERRRWAWRCCRWCCR